MVSKEQAGAQTALSAVMCDGLGWFGELDYKRMLLAYDKIYYLLPEDLVEFTDVSGKAQVMHFPLLFQNWPSFEVCHHRLDAQQRELCLAAARCDAELAPIQDCVAQIPADEQRYTWRVCNADGDLGGGASPGLATDEQVLAHSMLLNKFLLAADALGSAPISGKPYIHGLISAKYRAAVEALGTARPELLPAALKASRRLHNPVVRELITTLVPDAELEQRSNEELIAFKDKNRELFERHSLAVARLVRKAAALPASERFDEELGELVREEVWQEKQQIEDQLRGAWKRFFKSSLHQVLGGAVSMGVAPFLALEVVSLATLVGAGAAVAHSAVSGVVELLDARKEAHKHGLYYLMKLGS